MKCENDDDILETLTLKFKNKKLEQIFESTNNPQSKKTNKTLSIVNFIIALLTIILIMPTYLILQFNTTNNFHIEHLTNITLIEEIKLNKSSISSGFLFAGNYILINLTQLGTGNFTKEQSLLSPKIQLYSSYVNSTIFFNLRISITALTLFVYLISYVLSFVLKKYFHQKILFCLITYFFSRSFHTICDILIEVLQFPTESVFLILVVQVLIKAMFTYRYNTNWLLFSLGTLLSIFYDWVIFVWIIPSNSVVCFYLIANNIVQIICILTSYIFEKRNRNLFFIMENLNKERTYLVDLVYKMEQGFITYNKNILFLNNSMKRIISFLKNDSSDDYWEDNENLILSSSNGLKDITKNKNTQKNEFKLDRILKSNVKTESKILIHKLLTYLTEFNQNLPEDVISSFDANDGKENNFDNFYNKVIEKEIFANFTILGNINLPSYGKDSNKKFQIMFRVNSFDVNDNFVELMFIDVSEIVQNEREKAVMGTRTIYLSKIAHEFRNPISSIMELASGILDETSEKPKEISQTAQVSHNTNIKVIQYKANYINKLCMMMSQFLTDYTLITNLKLTCKENCKINSNNLVVCSVCNLKTLCKKCKICDNCISKNETSFDVIDEVKNINDLFRDISILERVNKPILFTEICENETNLKNNSIYVRTDENLLKSSIYNIIFNSYKSSICNNAEIKVLINQKYSNNKDTVITGIDIINNSQEINQNFINLLNLDEDFLLEKKCINDLNSSENIQYNYDIFNKNFEIYVAYFMIKKLGSLLNISSNQTGSTFSFTIINKIKDLCLSEHSIRSMQINSSSYVSGLSEKNNLSCNSKLGNNMTIKDKPFLFSYNDNVVNRNSSINIIDRKKTSNKNSITSIELNYSIKSINPDFNKSNCLPNNNNVIVNANENDNENVSIEINQSPKLIQLDFVNNTTIINRTIRVLIIDDESMVRSSIKRHLNNINKSDDFIFDTEEASNCFEAIEILYKSLIKNLYFDIIVIDEFMPNMRGSTLIKLLKQLNSENNFYKMNIISHTAFDTDEKKKFILESGANFIISKPVKFREFKNLILGIII